MTETDANLEFSFQSHKGNKRLNNEDYYGKFGDNIFLVADGVGGYNAGEVASRLAVDGIIKYFNSAAELKLTKQSIKDAFLKANLLIRKTSYSDPNLYGMSTTLTAVIFTKKSMIFANVGDSPGFVFRKSRLKLITQIHRDQFGLLTQVLGFESQIYVFIKSIEARENDVVVLATDGLTDEVPLSEMQDVMRCNFSTKKTANKLIYLALKNGGRDNVTVGIIKVKKSNKK